MNTFRKKLTHAGVLVGAMASLAIVAPPASAACSGFCEYTNAWDSKTDGGGENAVAVLYSNGNDREHWDYRAMFVADGEKLLLTDNLTDKRQAVADVYVYNKRGYFVDKDHFMIGTNKTYQLGSPDGSGDIPEGYSVVIRVGQEGGEHTGFISGTA